MNDNIGIRDIHFFTADGSDYRFDDLVMQSGVSTAIDENLSTCQPAKASASAIYDLQGRRVTHDSSIKKGIYVVGGKKVVK